MISRRIRTALLATLLLSGSVLSFARPLSAEDATVRAVLFYSPYCGHCHLVMTQYLPPLMQRYGNRLEILNIDASTPEGEGLFMMAVERFDVPRGQAGVPLLVVGTEVLSGSADIPARLPDIIEKGLASGGIDWPPLPLMMRTMAHGAFDGVPDAVTPPELTMAQRFALDPFANAISVVVLLIMLGVVGLVVEVSFRRGGAGIAPWPAWSLPVLIAIGLTIAAYLSFVEVTDTAAVCGPVGDCSTVQQSEYARLFGVLPIGILGILGYTALGMSWLLGSFGPAALRMAARLSLWGMALLGVLFSIYLTFLEPFVIGATCAWCLSSAIVMTLILMAVTPIARPALRERFGPGRATARTAAGTEEADPEPAATEG